MQLRTPVVFFIFNRPAFTEQVFALIAQAKPAQLLVIADGPRSPDERETCLATRAIVEKVDWDCQVRTNFSETNLGNKRRGSSGLDWVFSQVEEAIIIEDDTVPHPSLFLYHQELLERYRDDQRVMQINSTNFQNGRNQTPYSYYFSRMPHCWAWATWRRAWSHNDIKMSSWPDNQELVLRTFDDEVERQFMFEIFDQAYHDKIDTWDYPWIYSFLMQSGLAITPHTNLVSNIGWGADSTHCNIEDHPTARVPTSDIGALRHPPHMIVHHAADRYTFDHALELEKRRDGAPATLSAKIKAFRARAKASFKYRLTSGQ
ncbi:MAG: glycosyltransferase family 2 protein [Pyrinomonadaceae bacterium]